MNAALDESAVGKTYELYGYVGLVYLIHLADRRFCLRIIKAYLVKELSKI